MTSDMQNRRDYSFLIGLVTGSFIGAGLAIWLVPKAASEIRERITGSARALGDRASERYQQASACVDDAVSELTDKVQGVRDNLADAVVRGAKTVEHIAKAAKTA